MTDEKHWERAYAILLEASNKKIAELEEKLKIATQALEYIHLRSGDSGGIAYQALEELEKIK